MLSNNVTFLITYGCSKVQLICGICITKGISKKWWYKNSVKTKIVPKKWYKKPLEKIL